MNGTGAIGVPQGLPGVHKSKCVQCHMPPTSYGFGGLQKGGNHTFKVIYPVVATNATASGSTSTMPYSACSTCHDNQGDKALWLQDTIDQRQGAMKAKYATVATDLHNAGLRMGFTAPANATTDASYNGWLNTTLNTKGSANWSPDELRWQKALHRLDLHRGRGQLGYPQLAVRLAGDHRSGDLRQPGRKGTSDPDAQALQEERQEEREGHLLRYRQPRDSGHGPDPEEHAWRLRQLEVRNALRRQVLDQGQDDQHGYVPLQGLPRAKRGLRGQHVQRRQTGRQEEVAAQTAGLRVPHSCRRKGGSPHGGRPFTGPGEAVYEHLLVFANALQIVYTFTSLGYPRQVSSAISVLDGHGDRGTTSAAVGAEGATAGFPAYSSPVRTARIAPCVARASHGVFDKSIRSDEGR